MTIEVSQKLAKISADCASLEGRISLPDHNAEQLAMAFKALSDPVRLRVYHFIASNGGGSVCTCHMPDVFGITQPTLSYHLKRLVKAGLVEREMHGKWAHFRVTTPCVNKVQRFLDDVVGTVSETTPCGC